MKVRGCCSSLAVAMTTQTKLPLPFFGSVVRVLSPFVNCFPVQFGGCTSRLLLPPERLGGLAGAAAAPALAMGSSACSVLAWPPITISLV